MADERCDLLCLDLPKAERVRASLPGPAELERAALAGKALSDPTRLLVATALRNGDSACVCDLAWITGRDEKLVSHHLRVLKAAGLAVSERQGKMVMYAMTEVGRQRLAAIVDSTVETVR